jgi:hypothetical protein
MPRLKPGMTRYQKQEVLTRQKAWEKGQEAAKGKRADFSEKLTKEYHDLFQRQMATKDAIQQMFAITKMAGIPFGTGADAYTRINSALLGAADVINNVAGREVIPVSDDMRKNVAGAETFRKLSSGVVLQSIKEFLGPGSGQIRVSEINLVDKATASLDISNAANKVVLDIMARVNNKAMELNALATEYARKHGGLDNGFQDVANAYVAAHPLFTKAEEKTFDKRLDAAVKENPFNKGAQKGVPKATTPSKEGEWRIIR